MRVNPVYLVAGLLMPISYTAPLYLAQQLEKRGVAAGTLAPTSLVDLAAWFVEMAKGASRWNATGWRNNFTNMFPGFADDLAALIKGDPLADREGDPWLEELRVQLVASQAKARARDDRPRVGAAG